MRSQKNQPHHSLSWHKAMAVLLVITMAVPLLAASPAAYGDTAPAAGQVLTSVALYNDQGQDLTTLPEVDPAAAFTLSYTYTIPPLTPTQTPAPGGNDAPADDAGLTPGTGETGNGDSSDNSENIAPPPSTGSDDQPAVLPPKDADLDEGFGVDADLDEGFGVDTVASLIVSAMGSNSAAEDPQTPPVPTQQPIITAPQDEPAPEVPVASEQVYTFTIPAEIDLTGADTTVTITDVTGTTLGQATVNAVTNTGSLTLTDAAQNVPGLNGTFDITGCRFHQDALHLPTSQPSFFRSMMAHAVKDTTRELDFGLEGQSQQKQLRFALKEAETTTEPKPLPDGILTGVKVLENGEEIAEDAVISPNSTIAVVYQFELPSEFKEESFMTGQPYTFDVPSVLGVKLGGKDIEGDIPDEDGKISGHFSIRHDAGEKKNKATIIFYSAAEADTDTEHKAEAQPEATGTFGFSAGLDKDQIGLGGKQEITFPLAGSGSDYKVTINFAIVQPEGSVAITKNVAESGVDLEQQTIPWQVTVTPTINLDASFEKLTITDEIDTTGKVYGSYTKHSYVEGSAKLTDADGTKIKVDGASPAKYDETSHTLTCEVPKANIASGKTYTLSYQTKFALSDLRNATSWFANKASVDYSWPKYVLNEAGKPTPSDTEVASDEKKTKVVSCSVASPSLTKTGALAAGAVSTINWKVTINPSNFTLTPATITDTIPPGLTVVAGSVKLNGTEIPKLSDTGITYNAPKDETTGETTLTCSNVTFTDTSKPQELTYQTTVDKGFDPATQHFANQVVFTGAGEPGWTSPEVVATVDVGKALFAKSGSYNRSTHTIRWTLSLNKSASDLAGYVITDPVPEGLTLDKDSVVYPAEDMTYEYIESSDTAAETLKFTIADDKDGKYTITYDTVLNDDQNDYWATNHESHSYTNTATVALGDLTYSISAPTQVTTKVIDKTAAGFSAVDKTANWEITINQNKMPITNAVVIDKPDMQLGQQYLPESISIYNKTQNEVYSLEKVTITSEENGVKIAFKETINDELKISLKTQFTDLGSLESNTAIKVANSATLNGDEIPAPVPDTAEQQVSLSVVSKSGQTVSGKNQVKWTVIVNDNLVKLPKPILSDDLIPALSLDTDSIKLYKLAITNGKPNHSLSQAAEIMDNDLKDLLTYNYEPSTNKFVISFQQDISDAYALTFVTDVVDQTATTITNAISMKGSAAITNNDQADEVAFSWNDSFGSITNSLGELTIQKTSAEGGAPLADAEFKLVKDTNGAEFSKVTNEEGKATFAKMRPGMYTLTETTAPQGYYIAEDAYPVKVKISKESNKITYSDGTTKTIASDEALVLTNEPIKGSLTITKKDGGSDTPLAGAVFTLYQAQYSDGAEEPEWQQYGEPVTTGEDGLAVFLDLPFGNYYVVETTAPAGYLLGSRQESFAIEDNGQAVVYDDWLNYRPSTGGGGGGGVDGGGGGDTIAPPVPPKPPTNPVLPVNPMEPTTTTPADPAVPTDSETATEPEIATDGTVDPGTVDRVIEEIAPPDVPTEGQVDVPEGGAADLYLPPSHGTVTVDPDGHWVYTPDADFVGRDQFVIKVTHPDGEEEFILMDMEVPLAGMLPKTGETSRTGIYLAGLLCLLAGGLLLLKGRSRREQ